MSSQWGVGHACDNHHRRSHTEASGYRWPMLCGGRISLLNRRHNNTIPAMLHAPIGKLADRPDEIGPGGGEVLFLRELVDSGVGMRR